MKYRILAAAALIAVITLLCGCSERSAGRSQSIQATQNNEPIKTIAETTPEPYTEAVPEGVTSDDAGLYVYFDEEGSSHIVNSTGEEVGGYTYRDGAIKQGRKAAVPETGVREFKYTESIVSLMDKETYTVLLQQKDDGTGVYRYVPQTFTYEIYASPAGAAVSGITVTSSAPGIAEVTAVAKGQAGNADGTVYEITVTAIQSGSAELVAVSNDGKVTQRFPIEVRSVGLEEPDNSNDSLIATTCNTIVYVTNSAANFRREPNLQSGVISILPPEETVILLGQNDTGWAKVVYANQTGYVKATSLTYTKPVKVQQQEAHGLIINPVANITNTSSYTRVQGGPVNVPSSNVENDGKDHGSAYGESVHRQGSGSYFADNGHVHRFEPVESEGIITYMCSCSEVYFGTVPIVNTPDT